MVSTRAEGLKVLGREGEPSLTSCVTMGRITNLSVPQFLYLTNGDLPHGIKQCPTHISHHRKIIIISRTHQSTFHLRALHMLFSLSGILFPLLCA